MVLLVESVDQDGNPAKGIAGMIEIPVAEYLSAAGPPGELSLALPNPARGAMRLRFGLPAAADVRLEVLDIQGRHVHELARGAREAGWHELTWEGRSRTGVKVAPGVYFVRLSAGGRKVHRRTVWLN
jgi:hypothetical protein